MTAQIADLSARLNNQEITTLLPPASKASSDEFPTLSRANWKRKKQKSKKQINNATQTLTVQNRFSLLDTDMEEGSNAPATTVEQPVRQPQATQPMTTSNQSAQLTAAIATTSKASPQPIIAAAQYTPQDVIPPRSAIPPIVIEDKSKWDHVAYEFNMRKVGFSHVQNTTKGIKVQITNIDSHRAATRLLREQRISYFTFSTEEELKLRVVIKGISEHYTSEDIIEDLPAQGFHPENVCRMKGHRPLPMMLAILPREEKDIFNVRTIKYFVVKMEAQHPKASVGQCHRRKEQPWVPRSPH